MPNLQKAPRSLAEKTAEIRNQSLARLQSVLTVVGRKAKAMPILKLNLVDRMTAIIRPNHASHTSHASHASHHSRHR